MDLISLLRDAWHITWKRWTLWLLSLLMFLTMMPAVVLAGIFGAATGLMAYPGTSQWGPNFLFIYEMPAWGWVLLAIGLWVALVITTTLTWLLQVATVRGAALAADQAELTLRTALAIGRQRFRSLIKLSLTFGVLMIALAWLPPLATLLLSVTARGQARAIGWLQLTQTGLTPINSVLGLALFLLMMAVAVEDLTPLKALRRTWGVLRYGWWGFLLVFALSTLPSAVVIVLCLPLIITIAVAIVIPNGWLVPVLCGGVTVPFILLVLLFTAVFTTTMYTLVYRAAARLTPPGPGATPSLI